MFHYFDSLRSIPKLRHAITTREGGVSREEFASMNLAFHVGDQATTVRQNREILARELGFKACDLVAAQQVHSDSIFIVEAKQRGSGALNWESAIANTDAIVTNQKHLPLLILVADCAPILIVDATNQVFAVVHAGWRGALAGIAGKTARAMHEKFGSEIEDLKVGIGPCLSVENLEIGEQVAAQIEAVDQRAIQRQENWPKPHLDLRGLIVGDLTRAGVLIENIEIKAHCTREENERFFSHRGQNGRAGRFGIVAWWE